MEKHPFWSKHYPSDPPKKGVNQQTSATNLKRFGVTQVEMMENILKFKQLAAQKENMCLPLLSIEIRCNLLLVSGRAGLQTSSHITK